MQSKSDGFDGAWVFLGDAWLKKIYQLLVELYQPRTHKFLSDLDIKNNSMDEVSAAINDADIFVCSHDMIHASSRRADVVCPSFWLDGLASLEFCNSPDGKTLLGGGEAVAAMAEKNLAKITTLSMNGEIKFKSRERFERSINDLQKQETVSVPISDFILQNYKSRKVVCGVDRPTPLISLEVAKQIAIAMGYSLTPFEGVRHSQIGEMAFKPRVSSLLPNDSKALDIQFDADPFWFPSLGRILFEADKLRQRGQLMTA